MAWKTLCNEMEFLTLYPEVGLAISDTSAPVPGYLFGEINAITFIDYGNYCKPMVNFLVSRLEQSKPLVSVKILKLLLYLVKNGDNEMTEEVKIHEIELKEAMGFHGPPDDLHGKTFYENIRAMAKELLELVFLENREKRESLPPSSQSELTGYGSSASTTKLPGFGFSLKSQKSVTEKVSDGITNLVEKLLPSSEKETNSIQTTHLSETLPQYKPLIINKSVPDCEEVIRETKSSPVAIPINVRVKKKQSVYKPGRAGGGWDDSEDDEEPSPPDPVVEDSISHSYTSIDSLEFSKIELKEVAIDWADEHKVVDEFTVNEELSKMDFAAISTLCKRCSSLNCDKVLTFLVEKLDEKLENIQLRALIFVEYLLFHDVITLESLMKIVQPSLSALCEKGEEIPTSVKLKSKKISLIIRNLNQINQKGQPGQCGDTAVTCSS